MIYRVYRICSLDTKRVAIIVYGVVLVLKCNDKVRL